MKNDIYIVIVNKCFHVPKDDTSDASIKSRIVSYLTINNRLTRFERIFCSLKKKSKQNKP